MASYKFWKTQPVPQFNGIVGTDEGPIEIIQRDEVSTKPEVLVSGYEWTTIDLNNDAELDELYDFLSEHYVEDAEEMFRFNYSRAILKWAWQPPGWKKHWHVGIRMSESQKLVACICGTPIDIRVRKQILKAAEVNFLSVHPSLRSRRLTPVLIKEITRRCYLDGVYQAFYTSAAVLPKPVATCRYYHRLLNWRKLYQAGFTVISRFSTEEEEIAKNSLSSEFSLPHLRPMNSSDIPSVQNLLDRYLARFDLTPVFSQEDVRHWIMPSTDSPTERILWSYVIQDPETQAITDFISFFLIEETVLNNPKVSSIKAAYLNYYASESAFKKDEEALKDRLVMLVNDVLILAKKEGFDVFNGLTILDNLMFFDELEFQPGDGNLHYYLFNYRTAPISGGTNREEINLKGRSSGVAILIV